MKFADVVVVVVVFVVGSKLSTLIARYGPYKLERQRREQLSTGETDEGE